MIAGNLFYFTAFILPLLVTIVECIIGGNTVYEGQMNYAVSITVDGVHHCGGAFIGDQFVLTAAHCFIDENSQFLIRPYKVVANRKNMNSRNGVEFDIETVYVHAQYMPRYAYPNDIAVVKLKQDIRNYWAQRLVKLSLPSGYDSYGHQTATICGYGYDWCQKRYNPTTREIENECHSSYRMKYQLTYILTNEECDQKHREGYSSMPDGQLCALMKQRKGRSYLPVGLCGGDSGSPLVIDSVIVGVLSRSGCVDNSGPARFTRVSHYTSFIHRVMDMSENDIGDDDVYFVNL